MSLAELDKAIAALRQRVREVNLLIEKLERERNLPAPCRKRTHKAASD